jgi:hypothetical protein
LSGIPAKASMAHFKCDGCRLRLNQPQDSTALHLLTCPGCGAPLDQARDLSEIVGYRAIDERREPDSSGA